MENLFRPEDFLVIARRRGFWASEALADAFPRRLLMRSKPTWPEVAFFWLLGLVLIWCWMPKVLILGTSTRQIFWAANLRKKGWLKQVKIIADCQYLPAEVATWIDRVFVYSSGEIKQYDPEVQKHFIFLPYPSKTEWLKESVDRGEYIFCGGNNMRDHGTFIEAVKGLPVKVIIVTDQPLPSVLPPNCITYGHLPLEDYMALIAKSLFVVVPLLPSSLPHGHCDISSAFGLGKTVVSTRDASVEDYIEDGVNGFLAEPENAESYRHIINRLLSDRDLLHRVEAAASLRGRTDLTYEAFAIKLKKLAQEIN